MYLVASFTPALTVATVGQCLVTEQELFDEGTLITRLPIRGGSVQLESGRNICCGARSPGLDVAAASCYKSVSPSKLTVGLPSSVSALLVTELTGIPGN